MNYTGKIIVLAFPDTFVTMSTEWICKLLPLVGLGTTEYIKAGHAAMVLIENKSGKAQYFDFGRYVTPKGYGRVRGANTDAELRIPFTAIISEEGKVLNLDQILLWLDANPQKTHGEGRMLASVCDVIDYKKAETYIAQLQHKGSIPYGAFEKKGSNCARFVTDTILAATEDVKIRKALHFNKKFTPSTVGNVEKAASNAEVFEVFKGTIRPFTGSAFKENLTNYFHRKKADSSTINPSVATLELLNNKALQKLEGTGSSAWFEIMGSTELPEHHFNIRRYNELGEVDFDGVYVSEALDPSQPFQFTYDSHCAFCHILQHNIKIKLDGLGSLASFNLAQKLRSA